jgi:amino acid adenylation domain-containing protein
LYYLDQLRNNFDSLATSIAIQDEQNTLTYRELGLLSSHINYLLDKNGTKPGDFIGLYIESRPLAIASIIAILQRGCGYIPLDAIYPDDRLRYMLHNADARFLLTDTICPFSPESTTTIDISTSLKSFKKLSPRQVIATTVTAESPAYLIYTSGSTGQPKGVVMPQGVLDELIKWQNKKRDKHRCQRTLQFSSLSFDVSFQEIFSTLSQGGTLFTLNTQLKQDFKSLAEYIDQHDIERMFMPYVALQGLMQWFVRLNLIPKKLKEVITAGEQLIITQDIRSIFKRLPAATLSNQYGPSESHVVSEFILMGPADDWPEIPAIGRAIDHAKLFLLDEHQQQIVKIGEVGELYIGGPVLASGYINNKSETSKRFLNIKINSTLARVYRTGDLASKDSHGQLHYSGRVDSQVKISGYRIELSEIEAAILKQPSVSDAAVGVAENNGEKRLIAFIVYSLHDTSNIREALEKILPAYMLPTHYEPLEKLLTTPSGKIDRKSMLSQLLAKDRKPVQIFDDIVAQQVQQPKVIGKEQLLNLIRNFLGLSTLSLDISLIDAGMSSLQANQFSGMLYEQYALDIPAYKLFQHATIKDFLVDTLEKKSTIKNHNRQSKDLSHSRDIAIIGMSVNVPGASNLQQFWSNLHAGIESLHTFSATTAAGEVNTRGIISEPLALDAPFFNISPTEAEFIDPQQRIMLELAWHALEDSGTRPEKFPGRIGVFCGTGNNSYYLENVLKNPEKLEDYGALQAMVANEKDYTATRIAHKLNLNGPAVNIQTACSTSLVAICQAVESLRSGECEIAIAGGASLTFPQQQPHMPEEGSIKSHDGHTRPFDINANGTVFSDGGGAIVLKRFDYALEDNDRVSAIIKGVAINNDGANKGSFSAPSEKGQKNVILAAQQDAGITSDKIGYIEAHGTATPIGDPIEISALKQAFYANTNNNESCCLLGSVKSNLGHLTAAAGVIGLIKSTLAVAKGSIPASINFTQANPELRLENSPFTVNNITRPWPDEADDRYAGISSFGIGGTNAHVIIKGLSTQQDASQAQSDLPLCLSAKTQTALTKQISQLRDYLSSTEQVDIPRLKQSFCFHRQHFKFRATFWGHNKQELVKALKKNASIDNTNFNASKTLFTFPGQGTQVLCMGQKLYQQSALFKKNLDECIDICATSFDVDLKNLLFTTDETLHLTQNTQIALFSMGYAIARSLQDLGLKPEGLIGHSIGELAAATIAGVFNLPTAIKVVMTRGRVMQKQQAGSMLAVNCAFEEIANLIHHNVVLSACNTPSSITLSGEDRYIEETKAKLEQANIHCTKLNTSHAFHSPMMIAAEQEFIEALSDIKCQAPNIPFISCVTGDWITPEQACDIRYWASQIVAPVQFYKGVEKVANWPKLLVIDCGPKQVVSHLLAQCLAEKEDVFITTALPSPALENEAQQWFNCIGDIWQAGTELDWKKISYLPLKALPFLPLYPFDHKSYYIEPSVAIKNASSTDFAIPDLATFNDTLDIHAISQELNRDFLAICQQNSFKKQLISPNNSVTAEELPNPKLNKPLKIDASTMTNNAITQLTQLFSDTSGIDLSDANLDATFFELGLDSLFLTQLALKLKKTLKAKISFRQLMNDFNSFNKLAKKLESDGVFDVVSEMPVATINPVIAAMPADTTNTSAQPAAAAAGSALNALFSQQLQLVNSQISLLNQLSQAAQQPLANSAVNIEPTKVTPSVMDAQPKKTFGAGTRINVKRSNELNTLQQQNLDQLTSRYTHKFEKSKAFAQTNRKQLADPRVVSGFRDQLKELIFPIVVNRSSGAHLWDIDGNQLIDVTCGFGSNLFGNGANFIQSAIAEQLSIGYEIGPQTPLSEKVSKKFCQLTKLERVAFCNTGSEAVLGAIRLARTVTGKEHLVMFENDYHGINDEVIVNRGVNGLSLPAAAGIPNEAIANTIILDYDAQASLDYIKENSDDIAAVMIEPVQSRNPELQPKAFIQQLRRLCDQHDIALIFDEVITGFRIHPRGAQGYFGVEADIATYGKIIGGGMPIGVIGGKAKYMDALDGGHWQYGDDSAPEVGVTYFAGTFVRHPLTMAAANAVLDKLIAEPMLQEALGNKTTAMVEQMNNYASQVGAPIKAVNCRSLFRFKIPQNIPYEELIFTLLREKGIHIWDARPCFLTTAHGDEDISKIVSAFKSAVDDMLQFKFFPASEMPTHAPATQFNASKPPVSGARLGKDPTGKPAWFISDPEKPGKYRMIREN